MALIKCKECDKEISNKASACPHCGHPVYHNTENVVTTQTTKKKWKVWTIAANVLGFGGLFMFILGLSGKHDAMGVFGAIFFVLGFIAAIVAKLGAWWTNG